MIGNIPIISHYINWIPSYLIISHYILNYIYIIARSISRYPIHGIYIPLHSNELPQPILSSRCYLKSIPSDKFIIPFQSQNSELIHSRLWIFHEINTIIFMGGTSPIIRKTPKGNPGRIPSYPWGPTCPTLGAGGQRGGHDGRAPAARAATGASDFCSVSNGSSLSGDFFIGLYGISSDFMGFHRVFFI